MHIKTLCVFGTRPEAIKMAPIIHQFSTNSRITNTVCVTGQHQSMLSSVLDLFNITPDFDLEVMAANQTLGSLTSKILQGMGTVFQQYRPHLVLVHGDTTSTLAASLAAYYHQIPVAHVEAGLRTGNIFEPWPEEANRKLSGALALFHFAPTPSARQNLLREGVDAANIHVTGNTVIDALFQMAERLDNSPALKQQLQLQFPMISGHRKIILVTGHRRENFGSGFERICQALKNIAHRFPEVDIIYPVHLNPNVQAPVRQLLEGVPNIYLIEPVDYLPFVFLMKSSYLILTDSGGVQEEAPSLGKPVLVMRELTERPEAVAAGTVTLVGTHVEKIVGSVTELLTDKALYQKMSLAQNPYGDGEAARRIIEIISDNAAYIKAASLNPALAYRSGEKRHEEAVW